MRMQQIFFLLTLCWSVGGFVSAAPGDLDPTFDGDGKVITNINNGIDAGSRIAIQSDGKIIAVGNDDEDFAILRYNSNGTLDSTFDGDGIVLTDFDFNNDVAFSVAIQSDDRIVVVGYADLDQNNDFAVARYNSDGSLDFSFSFNGKVTTEFGSPDDEAFDVQIDADGRIVVAGKTCSAVGTCDFAVARYNSDGSLDATFGNNGKVISDFAADDDIARALAIQPDGKILAAGRVSSPAWHMGLARYENDGTLDSTFGVMGLVMTALGTGYEDGRDVGLLSDGKIIVAGASNEIGDPTDFTIVRFNPDGTLDLSYGTNGFVSTDFFSEDDVVKRVVVKPGGEVTAVGYAWSTDESDVDYAVARYTAVGVLDSTFGIAGKVTTDFTGGGVKHDFGSDIASQANGKYVVVGSAQYDIALARYEGGPFTVCGYTDNFEDGILDPNWTYTKPSWSESAGDLIGIPEKKKAEAIALPEFDGCDRCTMSTAMMTAGGTGNKMFFLVWYREKSNTVELIMKEENDKWILRQRYQGSVVAKEKAISLIDPNVVYAVSVEFDGTNFTLKVDDQILLVLPAVMPPAGSFGFRVKNTTGRFSAVSVCGGEE